MEIEGLALRILSINIWDLPIRLPGANRPLRRRRLLAALSQQDADIVLIQEAFNPAFRQQLVHAIPGFYHDHFAEERRRVGPFVMDASGGLLTLSRWPLVRSRFIPSRRVPGMRWDERIGRKGCLWTELETPQGPMLAGNAHLYAGTGARAARIRAIQARQIARMTSRHRQAPIVAAGDFNMAVEYEHPSSGPSGFDVLYGAGLIEVAEGKSAGLVTMHPGTNHYARWSPFHRPARRLTQVFYRGDGLALGQEPPAICLNDPPISDHLGLLVSFRLKRSAIRKSGAA